MHILIIHHFKIAWRFLWKHKRFSMINILGLSLGLAFSLSALIFIIDELSFDRFHSKYKRIYRINKLVTLDDGSQVKNAETSGLLAKMTRESSAEIEAFVRYNPVYQKVVLKNEKKYAVLNPTELAFTDESFFTVFDFEIVAGDPEKALVNPQSIVITERIAKTLFDGDPVGQSLEYGNFLYQVTGVIREPPRNSHIEFKALISWSTTVPGTGALSIGWMNNIRTQGICTYLLLKEKSNNSVEETFSKVVETHIPDKANVYLFYLQPLKDVYLYSSDVGGLRMTHTGNIKFVYFIGFSSLFLLIIVSINYINITVSRSVSRAKEVGIKKVNGASRSQLFQQFLFETLVLTILSLVISFALVSFFLPEFNSLFGRKMSFELLINYQVIVGIIALVGLMSIGGGIYPALILSSQDPALILKNKMPLIGGIKLRDALLTLQLTISLVMISTSLLINRQMNFILSQDTGFNPDNLLILPLSGTLRSDPQAFLNEIRALTPIKSASSSYTALGGGSGTDHVSSGNPPMEAEARMYYIDSEFAQTYDLKITLGRFFQKDLASDRSRILVNESLATLFNWSDPIGQQVNYGNSNYEIIGVIKDFYFHSMHTVSDPAIIFLDPSGPEFASIRYAGNPANVISEVQQVWKKFEPHEPMDYYFADKYIDDLYQTENRLLQSNVFFAVLTIGLSLMGLLGVFYVILTNKEKELAIRKTFGINFTELVRIYTRKYFYLILLAQAFAIPVVIYLIAKWLDSFRIHTDVDYMIFLISFSVVLVSALAIMITQIHLANRKDLIKLLRDQ